MNIFKSIAKISIITFISRIFGFIRDIIIAAKIGAGTESDIFFVALKLPNFFRRIFAEGAFNQAFIPIYSSLLLKEKKKALIFSNQIFFILLILLITFTILIEIFMPYAMYLFAPGFIKYPEQFNQLIFLTRISFPYLCLISLVSLFGAILNSHNRFIVTSLVPVIYNISFIIGIFLLTPFTNSYILSLIISLIIGGIVQLFVTYYSCLKIKIKLIPKVFQEDNKNIKLFFKRIIPATLGYAIIQFNIWADTLIASLIPNAVSYLYYADRINQLPLALIGIAIGTVLLPTMSKYIKNNDSNKVQQISNQTIILSLFFAMASSIGLYVLSTPIISTLFARGEFGITEIKACSTALAIYAIALPAFILIKVLSPLFFAKGNTKTPMIIAGISLIINIILNIILMQKYSFIGIVIATSIASWFNAILLIYLLCKSKSLIITNKSFAKIKQILISSVIMAITLKFTLSLIGNSYFYEGELLIKILYLTLLISLGFISYILISLYLKIFSITEIKTLLDRSKKI